MLLSGSHALSHAARIRLGVMLLMALGSVNSSTAQFVTPIPRPPSDSVLQVERNQAQFYRSLPPATQDSIRHRKLDTLRIGALRDAFCADTSGKGSRPLCESSLNTERIAADTSLKPQSHTTTLLKFRPPLSHDRWALVDYLQASAGPDGTALFSRFAANVSDDEAYVTTDIISGLAGRVMFGITYAAVVVKDETGNTDVEQRAIESQKANIIRMINNGGTVSARLQLPLFAVSGPTGQTASSVYSTMGLVGPTGNTDSLRFATTIVGELVTARSIRDFGLSSAVLGEVILGGRFGYALSEAELIRGTGDKGFPFAQFVFGLLQNDKISLSLLYTHAFEERYRGFAPKLTANFAAVR